VNKEIISLAVGAAMLAAPVSVFADEAASPLPPGGAAGVEQAQLQMGDIPLIYLIGGGLILGAAIWAVVDSDDDTVSSTSTGTP